MIYVANQLSNTVSVIDGSVNKVVLTIKFDISPENSGHIECDKKKIPTNQYLRIEFPLRCIAEPNNGFRFNSWIENVGGNSIKTVSASETSESPITSFFVLFGYNPDYNAASLNIDHHGSFTANFKAIPPPIPKEFVATLFTVLATAFIGSWLTPTVIKWRNAKNQGNKLDYYHNAVKKLYNDGKLDSKDTEKLNNLGDNITDEYARGKINKEQHDKLGSEISISYTEILKKEIDSLNSVAENAKQKLLHRINDDIFEAYSKRKN